MRVLGIDGCRGGWVAATVTVTGPSADTVDWLVTDDVGALLVTGTDVTGVDIPIGLPEAGVRACDVEARGRLAGRASSVFPAPVRAVLRAASYGEARALLAERGGASMSAQAFGIVKAVRAVDDVMQPHFERSVVETHPEVSFAALAGRPLPAKKTAAGVGARITALGGWCDAADAISRAPQGVPVDDALDALACAWSAARWQRGEATVLGDGARDARGLVMRIVC